MVDNIDAAYNADQNQDSSKRMMEVSYIEEDILVSLKAKKAFAFDYLYERYSGAIYTIIRSVVCDERLSNNILKESFIKIWKNIDSYNPSKSTLFTWMHSIARNCSIDLIKNKNIKKNSGDLSEMKNIQRSSLDLPAIGLGKILNMLPSELQKIIALSYFSGYTESEIADELNLPPDTVKIRKRAALTALRKIMET